MRKDDDRLITVLNANDELLGFASQDYVKHLLGTRKWHVAGNKHRCIWVKSRNQIKPEDYVQEQALIRKSPKTVPMHYVSSGLACSLSRLEAERQKNYRDMAGSHTEAEWKSVVQRYGNRCLRCEATGEVVTMTKDHVVPVSQGGANYASNLQPLCGPCNLWKGNRDIDFRGPLAFSVAS